MEYLNTFEEWLRYQQLDAQPLPEDPRTQVANRVWADEERCRTS